MGINLSYLFVVHHSAKYHPDDNLLEDKKLWIAVRFIILGNDSILRLFTRVFIDLMIRLFQLVTSRFKLVTHGFKLATHGFELENLEFELVTCGFELALLNFNSCFKALNS